MKQQPAPYTPDIGNPYTARDENIDLFEYENDLVILRMRDACPMGRDREADYIVAAPYTISFGPQEDRRTITVPKGMLTDLTSVPRPFRWLVERVGPHLEAAIVHDFLFIAWQDIEPKRPPSRDDWLFANRVMIAGMRRAEISPWICWIIARAIASSFSWRRYAQEDPQPRYINLDAAELETQGLEPSEDDGLAIS